jgi:hypothetical protein
MKKTLIYLLLSIGLIGCSSLELGDALSSEDYTQRILDLGLSHEENLVEASKLKTPHLISVVSLLLTNARDDKIQYEIDLIESEKFASLVNITDGGLIFVGSEITDSIKTGVLDVDFDLYRYYLEGSKDPSTNIFEHKLHIIISHNSKDKRNYFSANTCDQWGRCEDINEDGTSSKLELKALSSEASKCSAYTCIYREAVEIKVSNSFLKDANKKGFAINLRSKKKNHKIKLSKAYLMGYLKAVQ